MKISILKIWLLACVMCMSIYANADNTLQIEQVVGRVGKTVNLPVNITNDDEVVAAQFDVTLPFRMVSNDVIRMTNRTVGHSISTRANGKTVTVVLASMDNKPLKGNSGTVFYIPMSTNDEGLNSYDVKVSNIVLTDKYGNNIATEKSSDSKFIVSRENLPDFIVENITVNSNIAPGQIVDVNYNVKNIGDASSMSGFAAKIYLESTLTGVKTYVGTKGTDTMIAPGESLPVTATVAIPRAVHMDGSVKVYVEIIPNNGSGELKVDQLNNSAYSSEINLSKQLFLTSNSTTVREGYSGGYVTITLTRSGDWSVAEAYTIDASVSGLLSMEYANYNILPATVVIPAGTASTTFRIYSVNDNIVRAKTADILVAASHGYSQVRMTLQRVDDDVNPLSINLSQTSIVEGQQVTVTATRGGELTDEIDIPLLCSVGSRFVNIPVLHFAAGQSSASAILTSVDDDDPQLDCQVKLSLTATDYRQATTYLSLADNDRPNLTLEISPSVISESAGNNATIATLRRDGNLSKSISVKISSSRAEAFVGNDIVQIPAGKSSVEIPVGVKDNTYVDGVRQCILSAAMYIKADRVYAPSNNCAYAETSFTITDDETPYLKMSAETTNVGEGKSVKITLSRVVPSYSKELTVTLKSNDTDLEIPSSITIPSGWSYVEFIAKVRRNESTDDDRYATITAEASGLTTGLIKLRITDRTLPDAEILSVGHDGELYSGTQAFFWAEVHNDGTDVLPKGTLVEFYLASNSELTYYTKNYLFLSATIDKDLEPGETKIFSWKATVPEMAGKWWLNAIIDPDRKVAEFSETNNRSSVFKPIFINAPFSLTEIATDKTDYLPGEYVNVTGRVEGRLNGQTVRVSLEGEGQNSYSDVKINVDGTFNAYVMVDRSAAGKMIVKALALGQTEAAKTIGISVYNIRLTADNTRLQCDETYIKKGTIRIYNPSDKVITGIKLEHTILPYGCILEFGTLPTSISANGYADIVYTVNPTVAMNTTRYEQFTLTVSCNEGVSASLPFSYLCRAINSSIYASDNPINTTLLINSSRIIEVKITNYGLKETGTITMITPSDLNWISSLAPSVLPSLQPGQSATLKFQLNCQKGMHSGQTYAAHYTLNSENGSSYGLNFNIRVVGTEYSKLTVNASDVYSLANRDFSHIGGATVEVSSKKDGKVIITGKIDANGQWTTSSLTQGIYDVTIKAPRHNTVKKAINVGPGEDVAMNMLLPYKAVELSFESSEDIETNTITLQSHIDIDKSAPQAIVIPQFPNNCFTQDGEQNVNIVLTNVGMRPAINPTLSFPTNIENAVFTVNNSYPSILNPGESYVLSVTCNVSELSKYAYITSHKMAYGFNIVGNKLSETDIYQQITGNGDRVKINPDIEPESQEEETEEAEQEEQVYPEPNELKLNLPSVGGNASIVFEEISNIKVGQPIHAVLTIQNGDNLPMTNIRVIPLAEDETTEENLSEYVDVATSAGYTGFEMKGNSISLAGEKEGVMPLEFVFNEKITEDGDRVVVLDNQLSYVCGGISSSVLFPGLTLCVGDEDKIHLTYLLQKNFIADESSTEDVVESVKPAEAVMLIDWTRHNTDETSIVNISNEGLQVVANNDLHAVSYKGLYSAVNGQQDVCDFSNIQSASTLKHDVKNVHVIYKANEMAHVQNTESIVESTSVLVNDETLSNVNVDDVKELIRSVRSVHNQPLDITDLSESDINYTVAALAQGDHYLLNLEEDEYSNPDAVLDGQSLETYSIKDVSESVNIDGNAGKYVLTVSADKGGWVYGKLHDPTNGKLVLTNVVRQSDKVSVSSANFWQTDRTVLVDYSVINENLLHFADSISGATETYVLTYELQNDEVASIMSVKLYDKDGKEVKNGDTTTSPVVRARVDFTKPIKKFIHQSISYTARNENIDFGDNIVNVNTGYMTWDIIFEGVKPISGEHEFAIDASQLKDKATKQPCNGSVAVRWFDNSNSEVHIDVIVGPNEECGTVNIQSGDYKIGTMTINATPAPGFEFCYWLVNGQRVSDNPTLVLDVKDEMVLQVIFTPHTYSVVVDEPTNGKIVGGGNGFYDASSKIVWVAIPNPGYVFIRWIITRLLDNKKTSIRKAANEETPVLNYIVVDSDVEVTAEFAKEDDIRNYIVTDIDGTMTALSLKEGDKVEINDGQYKSVRVTEEISNVDISYTRTFNSADWQALYVPFSINVSNDMAGFDVYEFSSIEEDVVYVSKFEGITQPNTPYLIKTKGNVGAKTFIVNNGTLVATQEDKQEMDNFDIIGNYNKLTFSEVYGDCYALKDDKFQMAGEGSNLKPLRFYLKKKNKSLVKDMRIAIESITGICSEFNNINEASNSGVFNLIGQPVGTDYKGVVIINGKKKLNK